MTAENFAPAIDCVFAFEGGYSADPKDPGNWTGGKVGVGRLLGTKYGIAANTFPDLDIRNLTREQAREIYRRRYWDAIHGDALPSGVDFTVLDYAINSGMARAIMALQRAVGVADDGRIGPVTLSAVQTAGSRKVVRAICDDRLAFMKRLKIWPRYKSGWTRRLADVRDQALAMTAPQPSFFARAAALLRKAT